MPPEIVGAVCVGIGVIAGTVLVMVLETGHRSCQRAIDEVSELWRESELMRKELRAGMQALRDRSKSKIYPADWDGPRGPGL